MSTRHPDISQTKTRFIIILPVNRIGLHGCFCSQRMFLRSWAQFNCWELFVVKIRTAFEESMNQALHMGLMLRSWKDIDWWHQCVFSLIKGTTMSKFQLQQFKWHEGIPKKQKNKKNYCEKMSLLGAYWWAIPLFLRDLCNDQNQTVRPTHRWLSPSEVALQRNRQVCKMVKKKR